MAWSHLYITFAAFLCTIFACSDGAPITGGGGERRLNAQLDLLLNDIPQEWEKERQNRIREALARGRHIQPYTKNKNVVLPGVEIMSPTSGSFFYTMKAVARALNDLL